MSGPDSLGAAALLLGVLAAGCCGGPYYWDIQEAVRRDPATERELFGLLGLAESSPRVLELVHDAPVATAVDAWFSNRFDNQWIPRVQWLGASREAPPTLRSGKRPDAVARILRIKCFNSRWCGPLSDGAIVGGSYYTFWADSQRRLIAAIDTTFYRPD
jgi:hypothetical protein